MTRIPPEIIKVSIKPGSVYYFREESLKSTEKHYFVVINKKPQTDEIILLVCASSRIGKVKRFRRDCPEETVVIITPKQYSGFSVNSIFDCNYIFKKSLYEIMKKYNNDELIVKPEIELYLVDILRKGILASNQIAHHIKSILRE